MSEQDYIRGQRQVWTELLERAIKELGYEQISYRRWMIEREHAIQALRMICEDYGDNDWSEGLHLADVIEKHLGRHLDAKGGQR